MKDTVNGPLATYEEKLPVYVKVTLYLREQLASGRWPVGTKLPAIQKLADTLDTNYGTVYKGMDPLVAEGVLTRVDGSGCYVRAIPSRPTEQKRTRTALYYSHDWCRENTFHSALRRCLGQMLEQSQVEIDIWIDTRRESDQGTILPPLQDGIRKREISSIICPAVTASAF